ncbi:TPA: hypothetical protein ACKRXW_001843 [Proteus mirabilis]|uniref:hypothetical protein n=1 Tax=Proteus mirabilis TaxID=584 RepID=UPI00056558ED|nr:hypothetical protein [Proteus mirabilis]ARA23664.1 hypothetical protein AM438_14680 [Proteus mirabilis]AWF39393.1 hypothetical protein CSC16_1157 [Proteus mirabilis]EKU2831121.1 hypothetical protein [Proteus mirabilis]EKV0743191.1 hypothetical protein [Proteus mirabilis]EKW0545980.1 hypothetical protein [Proteus mirabilis]
MKIIIVSTLSSSLLDDINNEKRKNEFNERDMENENIDKYISINSITPADLKLKLSIPIKKVAEIIDKDADDIK